jgi:hypothetical protein
MNPRNAYVCNGWPRERPEVKRSENDTSYEIANRRLIPERTITRAVLAEIIQLILLSKAEVT